MTVDEAFEAIKIALAGPMGRVPTERTPMPATMIATDYGIRPATSMEKMTGRELPDFFTDGSGTTRCAPQILPPQDVEATLRHMPYLPTKEPFDFAAEFENAKAAFGNVKEPRYKDADERKAEPIYSGVLLYFPDALAAVARVSKAGNDKHNPGQPLHWSRGKSSDQMDANARHILSPNTIDPETREPEINQALWRLLAQVQINEENRNRERGVRSYSGL